MLTGTAQNFFPPKQNDVLGSVSVKLLSGTFIKRQINVFSLVFSRVSLWPTGEEIRVLDLPEV